MKKFMTLLLGIFLLVAFTGCASGELPNTSAPTPQVKAVSLPAPAQSVDPAVVEGVNGMGIEMLQRLYPDMNGENFMISPVSISLALSMTMNGAEGETFIQMRDALHFPGMQMDVVNTGQKDLMSILLNPDNSEKVRVEIANALWAREGLTLADAFQDTCRDFYDAGIQSLDFGDPASVDIINGWVDESTNGMIETILEDPIDPDTVLFLMNTLFFDGKWTEPFDPERTYDGTFTKADGSTVTVPMMSAEETLTAYIDPEGNMDCFGKPFGDTGRLEMLFVRPGEGIDTFLQDFSIERLDQITADSSPREVMIRIPRFSYDTFLNLNDLLKAMGMVDAFIGGFGPMTGGERDLYVSEVLHKTRIEVAEEGAKAAAVTSVAMEESASESLMITLDSPFLYLIRDTQTGAVLFVGVVEEPVES